MTTPHATSGPSARWRATAVVVVALALLGAAITVVASVVQRAEARFAGTTSNEGSLFSAATVDLEIGSVASRARPGGEPTAEASSATALTIDVDNMLPGQVVERCIVTSYHGPIDDVSLRLSGVRDGPAGLDLYLQTVVEAGAGDDPACGDFRPDRRLYDGRLVGLWNLGTDGVELDGAVDDGDSVTVRVELELVDDDRAQGLHLWFSLVMEARP